MFLCSSVRQLCRFISGFTHPLQTCILFGILRCPTSRSTAASHNIDSWFWFFLLSNNKLNILVYYCLRVPNLGYQDRTLFYSVIIGLAIFTCRSRVLTIPSIMSYGSTVVTNNRSMATTKVSTMAKASTTTSSYESSSMANMNWFVLWSCCWTWCL